MKILICPCQELEPALVNIASAGSSSAVPATAIAVATLRLQRNVAAVAALLLPPRYEPL